MHGKIIGKNFKKERTCIVCNSVINKGELYHRKEKRVKGFKTVPMCCTTCFFKIPKQNTRLVCSSGEQSNRVFAQLFETSEKRGQ